MKKIILILTASIVISFSIAAQIAGDYRSKGSGHWNDATKWELYNGSNWVSTTTYPGQNPGTANVVISNQTEITITATVPYPVSTLHVSVDFNQLLLSGKLVFSAGNAVSLTVSGNVTVYGSLIVGDQPGTKEHSLLIGGGLQAGTSIGVEDTNCVVDPECWYCYCPLIYYPVGGNIQTVDTDDKLGVLFTTTNPNSWINGSATITFQNVSFNGIGISVGTSVYINGTASFLNGIVRPGSCGGGYAVDASGYYYYPSSCGRLFFNNGATAAASPVSFVDGKVWKQGDGSFMFPIGNSGVFSPLTVSIPAGQNATLSANYTRSGVWPIISWGITDSNIYSVSDCEYWELYSGASAYDNNNVDYPVDITIGWSNSSGCGSSPYVTNVSNVNIAHLNFNRKSWESHGGSATGTIENGTVTWNGVQSLGVFTLGNINNNCLPPATINTTNITSSSASLNWSAVPGSTYDVDYKRNTTEQWTNLATATSATSFGLSGLSAQYEYDWRVRSNCNSSPSAYRLTRFAPLYPCGTPSGLNTTNITLSGAKLSWSPVTNATAYSVAYKQSNSTTWVDAAINIGSTSYTLAGLSAATSYDWRVSVICIYGEVGHIWGGGVAQASFTTLACNDVYETNNTSSQAKPISFGTPVNALISSANDVDWFRINAPNNFNNTLHVTLFNLPADYDLYVYNKNLVLVGSSVSIGTSNEVVIYSSNARNATYYIKIVGKNGAYNNSQCYNLLAQALSSGRATSTAFDPANEVINRSNFQMLYPNPASEIVYLNFNSDAEGASDLQILNTIGQMVKQYPVNIIKGQNFVQVPVKDIRPGMYILRINKGELNLTRKFVIAR